MILFNFPPQQVKENVPVGFIVGPVNAKERTPTIADNIIDTNDGQYITYVMTSSANEVIRGVFDVDRNTGSLVVAGRLDREQQSEYRVEIRALDTTTSNNPQSSTVIIKVEVVDVNDNAPVWPDDPINIHVAESTQIGATVFNFTAHDADAGANSELQYRLVSQQPVVQGTSPFAVDPITGALTVVQTLDYELMREYLLVVEAQDQSPNHSERLSTSVTTRVHITDTNDNAPVFVSPATPDAVIVLSDLTTVGQVVMRVVAVDADSGDNGRVTYTIEAGNEEEHFRLDRQTGVVDVLKPLLRSSSTMEARRDRQYAGSVLSSGRFTLTILARDLGTPVAKKTQTTVQFVVQGTNNHPPRFLQSVYHANVSENLASGAFVARVSAQSFKGEAGKLGFFFFFIKSNTRSYL